VNVYNLFTAGTGWCFPSAVSLLQAGQTQRFSLLLTQNWLNTLLISVISCLFQIFQSNQDS